MIYSWRRLELRMGDLRSSIWNVNASDRRRPMRRKKGEVRFPSDLSFL